MGAAARTSADSREQCRICNKNDPGSDLEPRKDLKVLLHVCTQHLLNDTWPEHGLGLGIEILQCNNLTQQVQLLSKAPSTHVPTSGRTIWAKQWGQQTSKLPLHLMAGARTGLETMAVPELSQNLTTAAAAAIYTVVTEC